MPVATVQEPLVDQQQAAAHLGLKNPRTLAAWRLRRCGPPWHRLGKRTVRYRIGELDAWVQGNAAR
jgi:hypothetical protein